MAGRLYGTGVGPGESALMTLKAVRVIKECDIIAVPVSDRTLETPFFEEETPWETEEEGTKKRRQYLERCAAYQIALPEIPEIRKKAVLYLPMPMMKDRETLKQIHDKDAEMTEYYLRQGKKIAFLTLGDPSVYSTYLYIHRRVLKDGYEAEMIPGIPSFCAAAARLNTGIVENSEALHIIPASYEIEEGLRLSGTKILMKAGKKMPYVKETVKNRNDAFYMVENCGMENERVYTDPEEVPDETSYFSLIMIKEES